MVCSLVCSFVDLFLILVFCDIIKTMKKKKYICKVVKNGRDSYYINIPKEIVRRLKIKERQKLVIDLDKKKIIITDWKK